LPSAVSDGESVAVFTSRLYQLTIVGPIRRGSLCVYILICILVSFALRSLVIATVLPHVRHFAEGAARIESMTASFQPPGKARYLHFQPREYALSKGTYDEPIRERT
jgi:hypothetical protein